MSGLAAPSWRSRTIACSPLPHLCCSGAGVTVSFSCEFLDAAREGELVEGTGEIMRAGGSMIFLRGGLKSGSARWFTFSGTIKRVKRRTLVVGRITTPADPISPWFEDARRCRAPHHEGFETAAEPVVGLRAFCGSSAPRSIAR